MKNPNRLHAALLTASILGACAGPELAASRPADGALDRRAVAVVLDDWHDAASRGDQERYLRHFSPDAVFLGTDASERWDLAQFTAYVEKYFPLGGWTYHPHDRYVMLAPEGDVAWFDEQLTNEKYGEVRGTGVLRRMGGRWHIEHYSMTFAIPNDAAQAVVGVIRAQRPAQDG